MMKHLTLFMAGQVQENSNSEAYAPYF